MALSNVKDDATKVASAPTVADAKSQRRAAHDAFVSKGQSILASKSAEEKALEGTKSGTLAFIACLGNPAKSQPRRANGVDVPSIEVVGYKLKALEDTKVPVANLKPNFKGYMDVEEMTEIVVKAGQEFNVNLYEAGALLSRPEYAGEINGEGKGAKLSVTFSANRPEPLPILKKLGGGSGSIKEVMLEVADMIPGADGEKAQPKVKDEFADKFGMLFSRARAKKTGAGKTGAKTGETTAAIAAAFNDYINNR